MKIATHNSGTGESGGGIFSFLGSPFSKCQSKTIIEQYNYGVRLFDLRVRKYKDKWVFAHGLWHSKTSIFKVLNDLNYFSDFQQIDEFVQPSLPSSFFIFPSPRKLLHA